MSQNWWEQDEVVGGGSAAPAAVPGVIYGRPKAVDPLKLRDQELQEEAAARAAAGDARSAAAADRAALEWNASHNPDGTPKTDAAGKPLPAWAATPYEKQIGIYGSIRGGLNSFQDDYAGNTVTGGLENSLQGQFSGFGTPGQRDWWSTFGSTDNVIRNDLFGAALTDGEKAAYAATTVNPSMDPKEVRRNLQSRKAILEAAMKRKTAFLKAQGYSKEAIEALAGEYAQELGAAVVAPDKVPDKGEEAAAVAAKNGAAIVGATEAGGNPPKGPDGLNLQSYAGVGSSAPGEAVVDETGARSFVRPEDEAFAARAQELFNQGGTREQFDALSDQFKYPRYGEDLDQAIANRAKGAGARILAPEGGQREAPTGLNAVISDAAASPAGSYFASAGNATTAGTLDEIIGAFGGDQAGAQLAKEAARINNPGTSFAGEVTGGVLGALAAGGIAGKVAPAANGVLRGLAADTLYGGAYGAGETNDNRVQGGVIGALAGGLGSGAGTLATKGASRMIAPVVDSSVQRLADAGVTMTGGQILGRGGRVGQFVKGVEDRIAGLPIIGETVNAGRREGVDQLNRSAVDEALAPIAGKLPSSVKTGQDAIAWGQQALSDAYDAALAPINAQVDNTLQTGLQQISGNASALPEAQKSALKAIIQRDIAPFTNGSMALDGGQLQAIKRGLDGRIASSRGKSPADDLLADTLEDIRQEFLDFAARADPAQYAAYRAADDAYANFVVLEKAAANAKEGIFSPAQFRTAVRQSDRSTRKRATAAGRARMQGLADAASDVLPSSVPDSGTAGRLVIPALALGAGGGAGYAADGGSGALTGAALVGGIYSGVGRKALQSALIGRPSVAVKAGEAMRLPGVLRAGGVAGTGLAIGSD